ncbi:MAG: transglycosylase SLT domain-containing protein [Desulfobaccales bacterium]
MTRRQWLPRLGGVVFCLGCLAWIAGCGGGPKADLTKTEPLVQEQATPAPEASDDSLGEELTGKHLEELYAKSGIPGWNPGLEEELKQWEHQVNFDVPIQMNKEVRAYLVYFSTERKEVIKNYLARSTRYLPMIKEVFDENGLPEDLAYLAMIESGFNCKAYSPAAASGMWQFVKGTGIRYGLTVDSYVDERRDPEKSTRAAAKYLLDLYKQFGSWYLAAASYNCGEGRVQRELDQSNHKNFWELSANQCLPTETKNYVPQMIAATIIAKNPEKFGFGKIPYQPPVKFEKVQVDEPTSLKAAAFATNRPEEDLQALNPELLRGVTPPDSPNYTLKLPANSKELFNRNLTLARIEYPAVASHPVEAARSGSRQYSRSRGQAYHHAQASRHEETKAPSPKSRTYAKATPRSYAGNATTRKSDHSGIKEAPRPVQASMFGGIAASSKAGHAGKTKEKTPAKVAKTGAKKPELARSRKGAPAVKVAAKNKTQGKNGASSGKSKDKDKYSKAKSPALMVSQAR